MMTNRKEMLDRIATHLGHSTIGWNALCETLGVLFAAILYPPPRGNENAVIAHAIWNSLTSDKAQRDMLLAAAKAASRSLQWTQSQAEDVQWLCDRSNSLGDLRNDLSHAPLAFKTEVDGTFTGVGAATFYGHPRAEKLSGKDLIEQAKLAQQSARTLTFFARKLTVSINFGVNVHAWPHRPDMPNLKGRKRAT